MIPANAITASLAQSLLRPVVLVLGLLIPVPGMAGEATIAVAANFLTTAERLAQRFEADTGHKVVLAHGSTGRLYAQIQAGAPFDVFLSADSARPARLADEGRGGTPVTYALGKLVLISAPDTGLELEGKRVALADPEIAPYGQASVEALADLGVGKDKVTLLLADSVGQVASIFATGNADAAFVAEALIPDVARPANVFAMEGRHGPIRQDAVLLLRGQSNEAAIAFLEYLRSGAGQRVIREAGYGVPE